MDVADGRAIAAPGHAAALADLTEREAATAADTLAAQNILSVGPALEFVHPLARAAVREHMPAAERMLAHRRAARLLARSGEAADVVAAQLLATDPSELRVARLAADGKSNREIAKMLFVTLRTVEVHLTHAYHRLSRPASGRVRGGSELDAPRLPEQRLTGERAGPALARGSRRGS